MNIPVHLDKEDINEDNYIRCIHASDKMGYELVKVETFEIIIY